MDIVGSTALKQSACKVNESSGPCDAWQEAIATFFSDFDTQISNEWKSSKRNLGAVLKHLENSKPIFWKGAGDEALYYVVLESLDEALFSVTNFLNAVKSVRKRIKAKNERLDLKATAWLAGFPVNNFEFVVGGQVERENPENPTWDDLWVSTLANRLDYERQKTNLQLDFVGPQIDLGFRLTALSTSRRMVISVDLAWLLIKAYQDSVDKWTNKFDVCSLFYLEERVSLKGVLSGESYPLIWIDTLSDDKFHRAEFNAMGKKPVETDALRAYCEMFIDMMNHKHFWMIRPFIKDSTIDSFGIEPNFHQWELEQWSKRWGDAYKSLREPEPLDDSQTEDAESEAFEKAHGRLDEFVKKKSDNS